MKKVILGVMCLAILASCNNVKNSDEYKRLQAERDSLMQTNSSDAKEITDLMSIVNEVEENFAQIKEAEKYLSLESNKSGELNQDSKERIKSNFDMINEILKKNKEDIETLNKKLKTANGKNTADNLNLKQTITRLQTELDQRTAAIEELRTALAQKDQQIAQLSQTVNTLNSNVQNLSNENVKQASQIKEQDIALNTGYYIFGTAKELKEAKLVTGGFLSSPKILKESINKSIFIKIDIRKVKQIPVYAKKAKILSEQPSDSYSIVKDQNGQAVINILDYKRFWSVSQFLVIQVD